MGNKKYDSHEGYSASKKNQSGFNRGAIVSGFFIIAEEMHFANPSFFSKYFRRLTGMTPGEFKKTK